VQEEADGVPADGEHPAILPLAIAAGQRGAGVITGLETVVATAPPGR
jgi:hypothetical protein